MRQIRPGDVLEGRYKIEAAIGSGGMGEVYRARRTRLGDVVAIKIIRMRTGDTRTLHSRFMAEARMCAMLHHPNIVSVLDFGVEAGVGPYLVMEHLNGPSLRQQLEERGVFSVPDVCRIASQIASALDLAHSQGVVHRDVKPGNVMTHHYSAGEVVYKVIDFGIGDLQNRAMDVASSSSWATTTTRSADHGRALLTLGYASPEQLTAQPISGRSDIYSFGITIYELLTGHRPFAAPDAGSLITKHLHELPDLPSRSRPDIPSWAESALLKALAKDPASRWERAADFAQALSGEVETRRAIVPQSRSRLADGYELGTLVGRGRLGSEIYTGTHRATGHQVAIRIVRRGQDADWGAARIRFMREARMTPVDHPSILRVRDYGEDEDLVYVVTDFVPGDSLRQVIDRAGPFAWPDGRPLLTDLISATRALHTHGLLAFGLTPSIIRITARGERKRLVISSAGVADSNEVVRRARAQPGAREGPIDGDALYLAPELLLGEKPDGRTDVFMIGAIGYELFTGRRPLEATTLPQLISASLSSEIVDPRTYAPSLPAEAAACLLRCLAPRPDERFSDAIDLESGWSGWRT